MKKRELKKLLIEKRINCYDIAALGPRKVYVDYYARNGGPIVYSHAAVIGIGFWTDPEAHWENNGCKVFSSHNCTAKETIETAKVWASKKYRIKAWWRDPFGGWQDDRAREALGNLLGVKI